MAKLNFIESQHPRMLSYVECRSDPVFYLVEEEPEPALDLDDLWHLCDVCGMRGQRAAGRNVKGGEEMVEITIKDDGGVKGTESGDFVMAIISTIEEDGLKSVGMAYGVTSDKASAHAIAGFVKYSIDETILPKSKKAAYKILRAFIDTEIKRLEAEESVKEETPEAATSGESGK